MLIVVVTVMTCIRAAYNRHYTYRRVEWNRRSTTPVPKKQTRSNRISRKRRKSDYSDYSVYTVTEKTDITPETRYSPGVSLQSISFEKHHTFGRVEALTA